LLYKIADFRNFQANFKTFQRTLDSLDRARAIFESGASQVDLDMPELVWKSYIDFEEEDLLSSLDLILWHGD